MSTYLKCQAQQSVAPYSKIGCHDVVLVCLRESAIDVLCEGQLTVVAFPEDVSHFRQPFSAASITVNWASKRSKGTEVFV